MHDYAKNWANNCRNSIGFDTPLTQGTGLTQSEGQTYHTLHTARSLDYPPC